MDSTGSAPHYYSIYSLKRSQRELTPKIRHHGVTVFIQQDVVTGRKSHIMTVAVVTPAPPAMPHGRGTDLFRSRWMMGWVRLCRYSMPLATSMAMMSLDCRSMSLSIHTSLKQKHLMSDQCPPPPHHTQHLQPIDGAVYKSSTWPRI